MYIYIRILILRSISISINNYIISIYKYNVAYVIFIFQILLVPIQRISEPGSTLPLVHLENYQSAHFSIYRHSSTVTPDELCMKD